MGAACFIIQHSHMDPSVGPRLPSKPPVGRLVGVDYGKKRVGIAVADPLRLFTRPFGTFSPDEAMAVLKRIQEEETIAVLVVGWPLTLEGEEGEATEWVQGFIERLQEMLPKVRIVKWDERYTSHQARAALVAAGVRKKARRDKARVDAAAAALILKEFMEAEDG